MYGGVVQRAQEPSVARAECVAQERHVRGVLAGRPLPRYGGVWTRARRQGMGSAGM